MNHSQTKLYHYWAKIVRSRHDTETSALLKISGHTSTPALAPSRLSCFGFLIYTSLRCHFFSLQHSPYEPFSFLVSGPAFDCTWNGQKNWVAKSWSTVGRSQKSPPQVALNQQYSLNWSDFETVQFYFVAAFVYRCILLFRFYTDSLHFLVQDLIYKSIVVHFSCIFAILASSK